MANYDLMNLISPYYTKYATEWVKYRDVLESGTAFKDKYLKQYSKRETTAEFIDRRDITYTPAVARASLIKLKNAIFQRMADITRKGGDVTYQAAIQGQNLVGIDNDGRSMNQFIGQKVILELMAMGAIGAYVDRAPFDEGASKSVTDTVHPYIYTYSVEDILNLERTNNSISKILLRRNDHERDEILGLYISDTAEHLFMEKTDSGVEWKTYGQTLDDELESGVLDIPEIPFVLFEIEQSLLKDIADYQIALLNIESGDINFCFKANFPFYTEQQEPNAGNISRMHVTMDVDGNETTVESDESQNIKTGVNSGRSYAPTMDRPGFINPSPEPLMASITKQNQMKEAIEYLIGINVQSLASSSANTKKTDSNLKEEGLSAIGLELERGERKIAEIWSDYMSADETAQVDYPNNYSLRTDADRRAEASEIIEDAKKIPSSEYQREAAKRAARLLVSQGISNEKWEKIDKQIDTSILVFADPADIHKDKELGIVSTETASIQRGYNKEEAKKAKADKVEQLTAIAQAQSSNNIEARAGGGEGATDEKTLSQDPLLSEKGKKVRGEEK